MSKKVGILTGGGDCPGLNPAIRAIVRVALKAKWEVLGFQKGWKGLLTDSALPMKIDQIDELLYRGGTILGTSRTNPYKEKDGPETVKKTIANRKLDALIAIGGEDTVGVANKLFNEGCPIVGCPKTIDNDLDETAFTIGFPTAVDIVTEALDRLKTTAESHERVMVVEIMGRHAGWLTAFGGLAGGADVIVTPEFPMSLTKIIDAIKSCRERGKKYALVAVAEGAEIIDEGGKKLSASSEQPVDSFGHVQLGGIADLLRDKIKKMSGFDTRSTVLGHIQRGGVPSSWDRILSTAFGVKSMELATKGDFGKMPALVNGKIIAVPLAKAVGKLKTLSEEVYRLTEVFLG